MDTGDVHTHSDEKMANSTGDTKEQKAGPSGGNRGGEEEKCLSWGMFALFCARRLRSAAAAFHASLSSPSFHSGKRRCLYTGLFMPSSYPAIIENNKKINKRFSGILWQKLGNCYPSIIFARKCLNFFFFFLISC